MPTHNSVDSIRRQSSARYARDYKSAGAKKRVTNATAPADVQRVRDHEPCFNCGSRGPCEHRPDAEVRT